MLEKMKNITHNLIGKTQKDFYAFMNKYDIKIIDSRSASDEGTPKNVEETYYTYELDNNTIMNIAAIVTRNVLASLIKYQLILKNGRLEV